jgi:hypothetical protein
MNVCIIVLGVMIACFGEVDFVVVGVLFQIGGIVFEAIRLVMVQRLLSSDEFKMDPLVSLYYFAPICALMNGAVAAAVELPRFKMEDVWHVGVWMLVANAVVAFALNISVVFLVYLPPFPFYLDCTDADVDKQNILPRHAPLRHSQRYPHRHLIPHPLAHAHDRFTSRRLHSRPLWADLLHARLRPHRRLLRQGCRRNNQRIQNAQVSIDWGVVYVFVGICGCVEYYGAFGG